MAGHTFGKAVYRKGDKQLCYVRRPYFKRGLGPACCGSYGLPVYVVGHISCYVYPGYLGLYLILGDYVSCLVEIQLAFQEVSVWLVAYSNENSVKIELLLLSGVHVFYFNSGDFGIAENFLKVPMPNMPRFP